MLLFFDIITLNRNKKMSLKDCFFSYKCHFFILKFFVSLCIIVFYTLYPL